MFNQLESESKNDTDITNSLQNQPTAIEKRQESETLMSNEAQFWRSRYCMLYESNQKLITELVAKHNEVNDKLNAEKKVNKKLAGENAKLHLEILKLKGNISSSLIVRK